MNMEELVDKTFKQMSQDVSKGDLTGVEEVLKFVKAKWIVINGNPVDGYSFYGTFDSESDADYWGSINFEESGYHTCPIFNPDGDNK